MAVSGIAAVASIVTPTATYSIRPVQNAIHVIQQIDTSTLPREAPPIVVPYPRSDAPERSAELQSDDGSLIDVLVVYTPLAEAAQDGTAAIEALIDLGISETNQAYANSGVIQRLRLVHKERIQYTESGSIATDVSRLQNPSDGFMDGVHSMRDTYQADLVDLVESTSDACGIAFAMGTPSTSFASVAFSAVDYSCISPNYSLAHELGHNMGLRHDVYTDATAGSYTYSHGYVNQVAFTNGAPTNSRWRDIMSYDDQCEDHLFFCSRLLYFSNPLNTYFGDTMGNANTADATRSLNNTRSTVANFRVTSSTSPTISINDVSVSEGNSGATNAAFKVTLSGASPYPVTVDYQTADNTATSTSNMASIIIPAEGHSLPYPSTITVPSGFGSITKLKVHLYQFRHTFPQDVDVLLVSPDNKKAVILTDVGSYNAALNVDFTFDDTGPSLTSTGLASGTYRPTNLTDEYGGDTFPSPAPAGPYGSSLSVFNGTNPAGTWSLFVNDDSEPDQGVFAGGWSLEIASATDYVAASGTLTFPPNVTSQTLNITVLGDTSVEANESFVVNLSNPINGTIGKAQGTGTIIDDDGKHRRGQITSN